MSALRSVTRRLAALSLSIALGSCVAPTGDPDSASPDDEVGDDVGGDIGGDVGSTQAALFNGNATLAADATIFEDQAGNNGGSYSGVCVGNLASTGSTRRGFMRWTLPSIPAGSTVTRVVLSVVQDRVRTMGAGAPKPATLILNRATSSWTEGAGGTATLACGGGTDVAGVDWTGQPSVNATVSGTEAVGTGGPVAVTFDTNVGTDDDVLITDVQAWVDGTANNGWRFTVLEESTIDNARLILPSSLTVYWTRSNGGTCTVDSDCTSGNCVHSDGADCGGRAGCVCCNAATCTGACSTCHRTGSVGTCGAAAATTSCRTPSCTAGVATAAENCNGTSTTCPGPNTTSCTPYACDGSACGSSCTSSAQCASGYFCNATNMCEVQRGNGSTCTAAGQCTSGNCVDGYCCNSTCTSQCNACDVGGSLGTCTAVSGAPHGTRTACTTDGSSCGGSCTGGSTCSYPGGGTSCRAQSCSAGVLTQPASCAGSGSCPAVMTTSCSPYQCNGAACRTSCSSNTHCLGGFFCNGSTCEAVRSNGSVCTASFQCSTGNCVDGYCCASACTGQCQACDVAGSLGACVPVTGAPHGTRTACTTDGSACGGACNGALTSACTYPSMATSCRTASCTAGIATLAAVCQGDGNCGPLETQDCSPYLCSGTACAAGSCTTSAECAIGFFCDGSTCQATLSNGTACTTDAQCTSGECVDGLCCNTPCAGQCEACDVAGNLGTCIAVSGAPHGARSACATDGSVCGGACGGVSRTACTYPTSTTNCRAGSCTGGVASDPAGCNGAGACSAATMVSCAPYDCAGSVCASTCSVTMDCDPGYYCSVGLCRLLLSNGSACTSDEACQTGECVDGVCCDTACTGQCEACNVVGTVGSCRPVAGAPRGGRAPCASDGTVCAGSCDGTMRTACAYPSTAISCRSSSCTSELLTEAATCEGDGTCGALTLTPCSPFRCDGAACGTGCTSNADCVTGAFCNASGVCQGQLPIAASCTTDGQCSSGSCADGICCLTACAGQCEACDAPGNIGTCTAVTGAPHGTRAACVTDGTSCGGACDGSDRTACAYPDTSTACRAASCAAGTETLAASCDGGGACTAEVSHPCSPFLCGATACATSCASDADCVAGGYCDTIAGLCRGAQVNGSACTSALECATGNCVDGVCCDGECAGQCESCAVPGRLGACTPVLGNPRNGRTACDSDGTDCRGLCDGANRAACRYPGSETRCRDASCVSSVATEEASCDGAGSCPAVVTTDCAGECNGDVCARVNDAGPPPEDAGEPVADAGAFDGGAPDAGDEMMDGGCGCRTTGGRSSGWPLALLLLGLALRRRRR